MMSLTEEETLILQKMKNSEVVRIIRKALECQEKVVINSLVGAKDQFEMTDLRGQVKGLRSSLNIISAIIESPT